MSLPKSLLVRAGVVAATALLPFTLLTPLTAGASPDVVNVVGYSVVKNAYTALENGFLASPEGAGISFKNSFGASGTEATNVANGQAADLVNLSLIPDVTTLVDAGKVSANWQKQEIQYGIASKNAKTQAKTFQDLTPGIVTDSVIVFVVRQGNPLNISSWQSLIKSKAQIITPDPRSSGSAKWNLLGAYIGALASGDKPAKAQLFLKQLLGQTISQPTSGSAALSAFLSGTGQVLLAYESDAKGAVAAGDPVQIITPKTNILIQNPLALTLSGQNNPGAVAFYKFLLSPQGQAIWALQGFRPVLKSVANDPTFAELFPKVQNLQTVLSLSPQGWKFVDSEFFSPVVRFSAKNKVDPVQGIVTYLEQQTGH